jgi:chromosome segregation protein
MEKDKTIQEVIELKQKKEELLSLINQEKLNLAELSAQRENLISNTKLLEEKLNGLEATFQRKNEELNQYNEKINAKKEKETELSVKLAEIEQKIGNAEKNLKEIEKDIEDKKIVIEKTIEQFREIKRKAEFDSNNYFAELENKKTEKELKLSEIDIKISNREESLKGLAIQVNQESEKLKEILEATSRNFKINSDLEAKQLEVDNKINELLKEREVKIEELKNLGISFDILNGKMKDKQAQYDELLLKSSTLINKEEYLKNYEEFLRDHFQKVGLTYKEFKA